jgi:hypothetical protein
MINTMRNLSIGSALRKQKDGIKHLSEKVSFNNADDGSAARSGKVKTASFDKHYRKIKPIPVTTKRPSAYRAASQNNLFATLEYKS